MPYRTIVCFIIFSIIGCSNKKPLPVDPDYVKSIQEWHQKRIARLKTETGWLNLVGLLWLKEGENTFGSDSSNAVIFPPAAPAMAGTFVLNNGHVSVRVHKDVVIVADGKPVKAMALNTDADSNTTRLEMGSFRFNIIKRGHEYGIRLRDLESPLVKNFTDIETYPIDPAWRIEAHLEPYDPPKQIFIPTVLNTIDTMECFGAVTFELDGKTYRIDPASKKTDKELFLIFGDQTNGKETYGGGRFIYIPNFDSTGKTILDFNKAYNPPCVFTEFATCPLPPSQNRLPIQVLAGEKMYGHRKH